MNKFAMVSACVFAVVSGVTGHIVISALTCIIGGALCIAVIVRDEHEDVRQ